MAIALRVREFGQAACLGPQGAESQLRDVLREERVMDDTNLDDSIASTQEGYKMVNRAQEPLGFDDGGAGFTLAAIVVVSEVDDDGRGGTKANDDNQNAYSLSYLPRKLPWSSSL
jgi:hypothetical protein